MADPVTLIVPVQLDALSVNAALLDRDEFRWWQVEYRALDSHQSPEPGAGDAGIPGPEAGVYLHWVLPEGLRHGVQDRATGEVSYPLVPNRWLVARFAQGAPSASKAWIVESDCPSSTVPGPRSPQYLVPPAVAAAWKQSPDPRRNTAVVPSGDSTPWVRIGMPFDLDGWTDRDPDSTFLTAMGPSNPAFPIYTPHNFGVFSFYDDMDGAPAGAVSYLVVGWYSKATDDPLASRQSDTSSADPYDDLLARLGWSVSGQEGGQPTPAAEQATRSLYEGMALSVAWDPAGDVPDKANDPLTAMRNDKDLDVAFGNTTIDAFTALVASRDKNVGAGGERILRAFQYDVLPELDKVNGDALLRRRTHQASFGTSQAGYRWEIVAAEGQDPAGAALLPAETAWLAQLNQDQQRLDAELQTLYRLQWRLNEIWWKNGRWSADAGPDGHPPGTSAFDASDLANQLDPAFHDAEGNRSLAKQVLDQLATVRDLAAKVPQPAAGAGTDPQAALQAGIDDWARAKGLDLSKKLLKATEAPRYARANDPVVVLSGVQPPVESGLGGSLVTRQSSHVVASLTVDGTAIAVSGLDETEAALPSSPALPQRVTAIAGEWLLLDPARAMLIAAAAGKAETDVTAAMESRAAPAYAAPPPSLGLDHWEQPWQPMFLEWEASYVPIPAGKWTFEGDDYACDSPDPAPSATAQSVDGISLLSPHAQLVLGSRLADFIAKYGPDAELQALYDEVFGNGPTQLPYLTQALTGFTDQLGTRDLRAFRRPNPGDTTMTMPPPPVPPPPVYSVADLAGYTDAGADGSLPARYRGAVTSVPYLSYGGISQPFHGVRQGQMWLTSLLLYDKFGRGFRVLDADPQKSGAFDYETFPVVIDAAMQPTESVNTAVSSVVQLPPRLVQPARLDFDLLDASDDAKVLGRDAGADPICAWVLPNHLDQSLLLFAPDGSALGEYRLVESAPGTKTGRWDAPPHSDVKTPDDLAAKAPHLAAMLQTSALTGEFAFDALLEVIDTTLWSTDPVGARRDQTLSVLVGRPLALVRAGLAIELAGPPLSDSGWGATFATAEPDFVTQPFAVRLGDLATRDDGVIGYFSSDYGVFSSVATPHESDAQAYVVPIGSKRPDGTANYLSLAPDGGLVPLTLLVDPRAGMHATTGVLPVKRVDLPAAAVQSALRALEVTFRIAPALTFVQPSPAVGDSPPAYAQSIVLPVPAKRTGTWSFWDQEPDSDQAPAWSPYGLVNATPNAQLEGSAPTLRDGLLQLVIDLTGSP